MQTGNSMTQDIEELDIPSSGFVDSDGLQIYFERFGACSPMILVHGWGADNYLTTI
jgi:hypothetical protein